MEWLTDDRDVLQSIESCVHSTDAVDQDRDRMDSSEVEQSQKVGLITEIENYDEKIHVYR